jgi:hypothetical protein
MPIKLPEEIAFARLKPTRPIKLRIIKRFRNVLDIISRFLKVKECGYNSSDASGKTFHKEFIKKSCPVREQDSKIFY